MTLVNEAVGIDRILVAVDLSPASLRAAEFVRNIAPTNAHIRLVSVADNPRSLSSLPPKASAELYAARAELLRDAADALVQAKHVFSGRDLPLEEDLIDLSKRGSDIATALIDAADDWCADLLIVGARQHHGLLRWVEGTVSRPLTIHSRCSLLIVPPSHEEKLACPRKRVLFAIDGSTPSLEALKYGMQFAKPEVHLGSVAGRVAHITQTPLLLVHAKDSS
ncbi:UspA domain protein (fragment) [Paraburkholderia ribeironis]|uniref:UspA domain protein n=1 Tax=Paraburkholderia ribeironis TaxID=1247936 RepID=A0A1N7S2F7_9BURK